MYEPFIVHNPITITFRTLFTKLKIIKKSFVLDVFRNVIHIISYLIN